MRSRALRRASGGETARGASSNREGEPGGGGGSAKQKDQEGARGAQAGSLYTSFYWLRDVYVCVRTVGTSSPGDAVTM